MPTRSFVRSLTGHSRNGHCALASLVQGDPLHRFRYLGPAVLLVLFAIASPPLRSPVRVDRPTERPAKGFFRANGIARNVMEDQMSTPDQGPFPC